MLVRIKRIKMNGGWVTEQVVKEANNWSCLEHAKTSSILSTHTLPFYTNYTH